MPYETLHECNVSEDVTIQQVTLVAIVVHQSQSNGVGVAHTFARYRGVATLDVVDRLVGRSGQCIGNHTLVLVSLQQLLRSVRIGDVQTKLQPRLELCVQVGAGTITHEV